jgi:hypothetical protein
MRDTLRLPWLGTLGLIIGMFLALNAVFALIYTLTGGISNAREGNFIDAFFFSVQTMGTIGYGYMYPTTMLANCLVVSEAICGLLITALATGLVFAKFSLPTGKLIFEDSDIAWGMRHADVLSETPDGNLVLDVRHFHKLIPTAPTPSFPYPRKG